MYHQCKYCAYILGWGDLCEYFHVQLLYTSDTLVIYLITLVASYFDYLMPLLVMGKLLDSVVDRTLSETTERYYRT